MTTTPITESPAARRARILARYADLKPATITRTPDTSRNMQRGTPARRTRRIIL